MKRSTLARLIALAACGTAAVWLWPRNIPDRSPSSFAREVASDIGWGTQRTGTSNLAAARRHDAADDRLRQLERDLLRAAGATDLDARRLALISACTSLAATDPGPALELALRFRLADQDGDLLDGIVQRWAASDAPAALTWINQQSAGEQRDRLLARAVFVLSQSRPLAAARIVEEMAPGPARDETSLSVLHQWARRDLTGALAWVERFPSDELQDRAFAELDSMVAHRLASLRSEN